MKTNQILLSERSLLRFAALCIYAAVVFGSARFPGAVQAQAISFEPTAGPEGGFVNKFHVHSDGTILAGTVWGLVYRSADNGQTWEQATPVLPSSIQAFESLGNGDILAGIGEGGVYGSSDAGLTWTKRGFGTTDVTALLDVDVAGLFLGTSYTSNGGVYRSTNNGQGGLLISSFGGDAVVESLVDKESVILAAASAAGLFRSTNGGLNWDPVTLAGNPYVLNVAKSASGVFFAVANDWGDKEDGEIFRSTDDGATWESLDPSPGTDSYVQDIVAAADGTVYVAHDFGLSRTADDGDTWESSGAGPFVGTTRVAIAANGDLLVGADPHGIYRSSDGGASWQKSVSGFIAETVYRIRSNSVGDVFAVSGNSVYRSDGGTGAWEEVFSEPLVFIGALAVAANDDVYTGDLFNNTRLYRSSDGGDSWETLNIPELANGEGIFEISAVDGGEVFVYTRARASFNPILLRSADNGATWEDHTPDLGDYQDPGAVREAPDGNLYFVTSNPGAVFRSTDRGLTWTALGDPEVEYLNDIAFHPDGTLFVGGELGLHRSTDDGATWDLKSDGLPEDKNPFFGDGPTFVRAMATASNGVLYVAAPQGTLFRSFDKGDTWVNITAATEGLNLTGSTFTAIYIVNDRIFLGSFGFGLSRSGATATDTEWKATDLPTGFTLAQNYPNPFNPVTTISFEIGEPTDVTLTIYDLVGREIVTLMDGFQAAGTHQVSFDAAGLTSGLYLYRLKTPMGVTTRSMTLLK